MVRMNGWKLLNDGPIGHIFLVRIGRPIWVSECTIRDWDASIYWYSSALKSFMTYHTSSWARVGSRGGLVSVIGTQLFIGTVALWIIIAAKTAFAAEKWSASTKDAVQRCMLTLFSTPLSVYIYIYICICTAWRIHKNIKFTNWLQSAIATNVILPINV